MEALTGSGVWAAVWVFCILHEPSRVQIYITKMHQVKEAATAGLLPKRTRISTDPQPQGLAPPHPSKVLKTNLEMANRPNKEPIPKSSTTVMKQTQDQARKPVHWQS